MRKMMMVAALLAMLPALEAAAGLDPSPDSFGVYFDPQGNSLIAMPGPFVVFHAYLIAANPLAPIDFFECTVTRVGAPCFVLGTSLGDGTVDADESADGLRVTRATPYPVQSGVVVLADWTWLMTAPGGMWVYVGPGTDPVLPGGWPVLGDHGVYRLGDIWTGSPDIPVACVNEMSGCVVADAQTSFGALKSLYR